MATLTPITDQGALRVCTLSGLQGTIATERLVTLRSLRDTLRLAIADAQVAERDERFWGRMLIGAKLTKATCDLIMDILAEMAGPIGGGKVVKAVYDQADTIGEATVGEFNPLKAGQRAAEGASNFIPSGQGKQAAEIVLKRSGAVVDALNNDFDADDAIGHIVDTKLQTTEMSLEYLGKEKAAKVVGRAKTVFNYSLELYGIFKDRDTTSGVAAARKTAMNQLEKIEKKIAELEEAIAACEGPRIA